MSWSDSSFRFRIGAAGAALLLSLTLSGCFTPVYMDDSNNGVMSKLREVEVAPLPERLGHYLDTELIFQLNGSGEAKTPKYRLTITTDESNKTLVIDSLTGRADSASVYVNANYHLTEIATGKEITQGTVTSTAPYDRSSQRYANIRAARDSEIRVAESLARDIKTRLSAFFANQGGSSAL